MTSQSRGNALDHVVVVVFENRSLEWSEHGADRKIVPSAVTADMDSPNPDTGEEHQHTNTQLFNILDEQNRTFTDALTLDAPRDPGPWPVADPRPVPSYIQDALALGQSLSALGKAAFNGIRAYAEQNHIRIDGLPADPDAEIPAEQALPIIHSFLAIQFPLLHRPLPVVPPPQSKLGVRQP